MSDMTFGELGLPQELLEAVQSLGYESPSAIQAAAIPPALAGKDLVGLSETGSGKTAAFGLPLLAKVDLDVCEPQALVVCPTRELANQVCEEMHRLAVKKPGFRAVPVYGGAPIDRQFRQLRQGAHLIVGTPGRLMDHLRRGTFDPTEIKMIVLDEADRMLDMGFRDEMEEMLDQMPEDRQTLFFSATMNKGVRTLIEKFGNEPRTIEIKRKTLTVEAIEQVSYEVRNRSRVEVLSRLLDMDQPRLAIVFCNTRRVVDEVTETLLARGYAADRLHGDISQDQRERTLSRFRDGSVELLIATDVAARGIDIEEIDLVVNYDLPQDPEDYVHRIGRTGRAGRKGRAVTFVYGRDIYRLQTVERYTKQRIPRGRIPSLEEVQGKRVDQLFETVKERLEGGEWPDFSGQVDRLLEQGHTATDIASVVLALLHEESGREAEEIMEDKPERPRRQREEREDRFDDGEREPRRNKREFQADEAEEGMVRLFLNMGKIIGILPKDIAGLLYNEANLPRGSVGRIHLFPKHSLIEVKAEFADQAINACSGAKLRGKEFRLDRDRSLGDRPEPQRRFDRGERGDRGDRGDRFERGERRPFRRNDGDGEERDFRKKKFDRPDRSDRPDRKFGKGGGKFDKGGKPGFRGGKGKGDRY